MARKMARKGKRTTKKVVETVYVPKRQGGMAVHFGKAGVHRIKAGAMDAFGDVKRVDIIVPREGKMKIRKNPKGHYSLYQTASRAKTFSGTRMLDDFGLEPGDYPAKVVKGELVIDITSPAKKVNAHT